MTAGDDPDAELAVLLRQASAAPVDYPPGLVNRSLAAVRAERDSAGPFELPQDGGLLQVSAAAVTALAKRLGAELCATLGGLRQREVRVSGTEVVVTVEIGYGTPASRAEQLGATLAAALTDWIGPITPGVTVHLGDIYLDDTER